VDLSRVKLAAFDVDGVLTDGSLMYSGSDVIQVFHAADGTGLMELAGSGVHVALVSFRDHPATRRRARDLGITLLCLGATDKEGSMEELCRFLDVDPEDTVFMGDDLRDIPALSFAGFSACPSDARPEVREICDLVTEAPGGHGAVRELCDMILRTGEP
jgi:3-deoxy-D-manno-octulosonate 8-phosphate phosphatase (KDO 8-P phosphatase)